MHKDVHKTFIHCTLKLETKKQPKFPLMVEPKNKLWHIHMKDYNISTSNHVGESHKHYVGQKKSDTKEYRMIPFIQAQ